MVRDGEMTRPQQADKSRHPTDNAGDHRNEDALTFAYLQRIARSSRSQAILFALSASGKGDASAVIADGTGSCGDARYH